MAQQYSWPPVSVSSSGTQPVSGTMVLSGGTVSVQNVSSGTLAVVQRDRTLITSGFSTGSGTIAAFVSDGMATCGFGLNGTFTGTITVSASVDAVNFNPINAVNVSTNTASSTITLAGQYIVPCAGLQKIQIIGVLASGTCNVDVRANQGAGFVYTNSISGTQAISSGTIAVSTGTIASITNLAAGSVAITAGTVTVSGTVINAGGTITNVAGGTIAISTGTIASITNLAAGSVAITSGTVTVSGTVINAGGTVTNIAGGTIAINTGTIASITNVAGGTVAVSTGTIASVTNLAGGTISITAFKSSTASVTSVGGSSAAAVTILAANANRKTAAFYNNSSGTCFLALGTLATTALFTVAIPPNGYYEIPGIFSVSGSITGIWSTANGTMTITEVT